MSDDDDAPAGGGGSFEPGGADAAGLWDFTPVPEPVDPVEQDALTDKIIDRDLIGSVEGAGLAPMGVGRAVPEEYFRRFARILPRSVLRVWRRFGFEGFGQGLFWITDPLQWAPIVGEWLGPVRDRLPFTDTFYCLSRNAMGRMYLWGERTGNSLEIDPTYSEVVIDQLAIRSFSDPDIRQQAGRVIMSGPASIDGPEDEDWRPLPPQALERLGPVGADQVYGFVLPPVLGGTISVDNLRVMDARAYLTLQAQQGEITIADPVGANWAQVATIIGADPGASPLERPDNEHRGKP